MSTQFTIFKKGLTLIAVPLLVQAVFIAVLVKAQADHDRAQEWAVHTKDVIAKVEELHRSLVEAYAGVRGLIFSVAPANPGRYEAALRGVPAQLGDLRGLVADNERQGPRISDLAGRVDAFLGWVADEDRLVRAGDRDRAMVGLDRGSQLLEAVRGTIDAVRGEEEGLDRQRMGRLRSSSTRQVWTLVVGGAAIVVSTLILALLFLQGIIQRLAVLRENARRFAEGKPLNPPLAGRDEITEVDRSFHDMADNLGQQKQENEMFVYSVSHDLRSPLVNLQGFSEELSLSCRDLRELFRPRRRARAGPSPRPAAHGPRHRGVDPLHPGGRGPAGPDHRRPAAALPAGRVEYQLKEVDLAATVGKIVDALHDTITAKGARVVVGDLPPAWGDPTALEQVFANLIGNAVQYLDPGRPGRIEVDGDEPHGHGLPRGLKVYRVRDNGLGIPEAYHHRMFTAFSRLHAGVAQGEGIGLALVRRMVERHGGRIWLESAPGVGTTFFVALPAADGDGSQLDAGGNGPPLKAVAAGSAPAYH